MPSAIEYATEHRAGAMLLARSYVHATHMLPRGAEVRVEGDDLWATLPTGVSIRITSLDDLLATDAFAEYIIESDDYEMFATNGDGF